MPLLLATSFLCAEPVTVYDLDQEIQSLRKELHHYELKKVDEQVDGQGLMIADWEAYGRDIQRVKEDQDKIIELQKRIETLQKKKEGLQQEHSTSK